MDEQNRDNPEKPSHPEPFPKREVPPAPPSRPAGPAPTPPRRPFIHMRSPEGHVPFYRKIDLRFELFKKPWFIISATSALILLLAAISINDIMNALLHSREEVVVPEIEQMTLMEALELTSSLNLSLIQDGSEFDETVAAGTIVRQHPPAGMEVREGRAVRVIVSKGGQVVFIPLVVGSRLAEAQSMLALDGLQLGAVNEIYSIDSPNNAVISQQPSSGTVVTKGALIDLVISKGAPPPGAPIALDFVGKPVEVVREWAGRTGVSIDITEDPKAAGAAGTVVRQDPIGGQPAVGKEMRLTIVPILANEQGYRFTYRIPEKFGKIKIRIKARDNRGEFEVYEGRHQGGDRIEIPMSIESTTRARIYIDGRLQQERVIEP